MTLQWTSTNATEAWIASYPTLSDAGDPKTNPNALGPLPPNGTVSVRFACSDAANPNEYTLQVYAAGSSQRENILVNRNF